MRSFLACLALCVSCSLQGAVPDNVYFEYGINRGGDAYTNTAGPQVYDGLNGSYYVAFGVEYWLGARLRDMQAATRADALLEAVHFLREDNARLVEAVYIANDKEEPVHIDVNTGDVQQETVEHQSVFDLYYREFIGIAIVALGGLLYILINSMKSSNDDETTDS